MDTAHGGVAVRQTARFTWIRVLGVSLGIGIVDWLAFRMAPSTWLWQPGWAGASALSGVAWGLVRHRLYPGEAGKGGLWGQGRGEFLYAGVAVSGPYAATVMAVLLYGTTETTLRQIMFRGVPLLFHSDVLLWIVAFGVSVWVHYYPSRRPVQPKSAFVYMMDSVLATVAALASGSVISAVLIAILANAIFILGQARNNADRLWQQYGADSSTL